MSPIKIGVIGDRYSGKTTLIESICGIKANQVEAGIKQTQLCINEDDRELFEFWEYDRMILENSKYTSSHFNELMFVLIVYDVTNQESFRAISNYLNEVIRHNRDCKCFLIGNKIDSELREVQEIQAKCIADKYKVTHLEISALERKNFELLMFELKSNSAVETFINSEREVFGRTPLHTPNEKLSHYTFDSDKRSAIRSASIIDEEMMNRSYISPSSSIKTEEKNTTSIAKKKQIRYIKVPVGSFSLSEIEETGNTRINNYVDENHSPSPRPSLSTKRTVLYPDSTITSPDITPIKISKNPQKEIPPNECITNDPNKSLSEEYIQLKSLLANYGIIHDDDGLLFPSTTELATTTTTTAAAATTSTTGQISDQNGINLDVFKRLNFDDYRNPTKESSLLARGRKRREASSYIASSLSPTKPNRKSTNRKSNKSMKESKERPPWKAGIFDDYRRYLKIMSQTNEDTLGDVATNKKLTPISRANRALRKSNNYGKKIIIHAKTTSLILVIDVGLPGGGTAQIKVFEGDSPNQLAYEFTRDHKLDKVYKARLSELIQERVDQFFDSSIRRIQAEKRRNNREDIKKWKQANQTVIKPFHFATEDRVKLKKGDSKKEREFICRLHIVLNRNLSESMRRSKTLTVFLIIRRGDDPDKLVNDFSLKYPVDAEEKLELLHRIQDLLMDNGDDVPILSPASTFITSPEKINRTFDKIIGDDELLYEDSKDSTWSMYENSFTVTEDIVLTDTQKKLFARTLLGGVVPESGDAINTNMYTENRSSATINKENITVNKYTGSPTQQQQHVQESPRSFESVSSIHSPCSLHTSAFLFNLDIDIGDGRSDILQIYENHEPFELAEFFVTKHHLNRTMIPKLQMLITENIKRHLSYHEGEDYTGIDNESKAKTMNNSSHKTIRNNSFSNTVSNTPATDYRNDVSVKSNLMTRRKNKSESGYYRRFR